MDSLNRHYLKAYNRNSPVKTPNIDRLAAGGIVFDNHFAGSLPCMPARREMLTGRYNFLETPWGPIEPWDVTLPRELADQKNTYSHMITDHYHYFHSGGDGYHTRFSSWELERGQEGDLWKPVVKEPEQPPARGKGLGRRAYWANRECMDREEDLSYPTPRCFRQGMEFLDRNHDAENWHLHLEVFDPHEPFDCPRKYLDMYDDDWSGYLYNWPEYGPLSEEDTPEAVAHIRRRYAGCLTMADRWLGEFLDRMDRYGMWKDTVLILTTDHGHLLGEHGYWAKNYMRDYPELAHIPLIVRSPEIRDPGGRRDGMTATVDLMPTIMELHGAAPSAPIHGQSFASLIEKDGKGRGELIWGYFGKDVNYFDGRHLYVCQPDPARPVHHHTLMPAGFRDYYPGEVLKKAEFGPFLGYTEIPQMRWEMPSFRHRDAPEHNMLFDLTVDPDRPLESTRLEEEMKIRLARYLRSADAPACQFARLGLPS